MEPTKPIGEENKKPAKEEAKKTELEYDADAVRPFLGRPSANPNPFFRGEAAFPGTLGQSIGNNYYYHATTLGNLPGILEQGLDPDMGGRGGAGEYIAAPVDQEAGDEFARRDAGFVYLADNAEIAARYAFQYDDQADGYGGRTENGRDNIQRSAVILRIREENLNPGMLRWDRAEEEGAYRTEQRLIPSNLEILTEGGWTPLRDREVRQEVYRNANETLGRMGPYNRLPEDENDIRAREELEGNEAEQVREEPESNEAEQAGAGRVRIPLEAIGEEEVQRRPRQMRENGSVSPAKITEPSKDKGFGL